jgi:hypothetical protein
VVRKVNCFNNKEAEVVIKKLHLRPAEAEDFITVSTSTRRKKALV